MRHETKHILGTTEKLPKAMDPDRQVPDSNQMRKMRGTAVVSSCWCTLTAYGDSRCHGKYLAIATLIDRRLYMVYGAALHALVCPY